MPVLSYQQNLTGVQVPRSEVLNSRPWAVIKLIGFIIAFLVAVAGLLLAGAMLGGARPRFHLERPAGEHQQTGQQAPQATPPSATAAPAAPPASVNISLPEVRVVLPPENRQSRPAPASNDEALERKFRGYLLTEGEDP